VQDELNSMSKQGKWVEMANCITDEILDAFAVVSEPEDIASKLDGRYGDVISRISFYVPYASDPARWNKVLADVQNA
jgi:hypothetical protein